MLSNLIVPVLNRYDLLNRMLDTINYPVGHLLIVDNGGQLGKPDCLWADKVTVLNMPSNLGVAGSWNLGIMSLPHEPYWAFASNDAFFFSGTMARMSETGPDDMLMSTEAPFWQVFTLGENVVRNVGLFGWGFMPAYFEDNDYSRRAERWGFVKRNVLDVGHNNSSTLHSDPAFQQHNVTTFSANQALYRSRSEKKVMGAGEWELDRRRALEWVR